MQTLTPRIGDRLEDLAAQMIARARATQDTVQTRFNDVRLVATATTTIDDLLRTYEHAYAQATTGAMDEATATVTRYTLTPDWVCPGCRQWYRVQITVVPLPTQHGAHPSTDHPPR